MWNYPNKYGKLEIAGIPQMTPKAIGKYYKDMSPYISGAYMESATDKYIYNYLNYYIFGKVSWNNDIDVKAVLDEHYKLMFGPAAKVMQSIDERFEELWLRDLGGRTRHTPLGEAQWPPTEYEVWEKTYSQDEVNKLKEKYDKAEKLAASDKKALARVKFFRKHFLDSMIEGRKNYYRTKNEIEDLTFNVKDLPDGKTIKVDGKIDDPAWQESRELYLLPYKGNPEGLKTAKTLVYGLKDKNKIYFAFKCEEPSIKNMIYMKREHDDKDIWRDSSVEIFLNPSGDKINYYQFIINPSGSYADLSAKKVGSDHVINWKWNGGPEIKTAVSENSWTAEIAIDLEKLSGFTEKGFPANFNRNRVLNQGKDYITLYTWSPFLRHGFHDLQHFGTLLFGKPVDNSSIIENGDFTVAPRGKMFGKWYGTGEKSGQICQLDKSTFMKGGQSLKLGNEQGKQRVFVTQFMPKMKPDTKYLLTFYVKTKDIEQKGRYGGAVVNVWTDKNHWFPKSWYLGTMPWAKQGFEFKSGPETNKKRSAYIRLYIMGATGSVWFDDVRLREVE